MDALRESNLASLPLLRRGKVRDLYALGSDRLLIVATDRLSAFDVIMSRPIPGKGKVLTALTRFWMRRFADIIPNHEVEADLATVLSPVELAQCEGRSVVTRRLKPLPVEAVARGYLIGSGWKEYQATRSICGVALPPGLRMADRLPEAVFTPAYKAPAGQHDANIDYERVVRLVGEENARRVREATLHLYREAAAYALERGIIIADTKFEFGVDEAGTLYLIDEVLTPDSSRFWPAAQWHAGENPPSFDKQYVRDYLETLDWNKTAPGPELPDEIVERTAAKYREAERLLTSG
ncbi:MAG TPA: phosphoribosylaminoimidazolesuccinocarboxamide synthase [Nevskiaceae bacterium]